MSTSLTEILDRQVFLIEQLGARNDSDLSHLKAVVFVRPTPMNIMLLAQELKQPQYRE